MNVFLLLQRIGVRDRYPEYGNAKIRLSNLAAIFVMAFVAVPFTVIAYIHVPELILIPLTSILALALVWVFNRVGAVYLARIFVAVIPLLLTAIFAANLNNGNEAVPFGVGTKEFERRIQLYFAIC